MVSLYRGVIYLVLPSKLADARRSVHEGDQNKNAGDRHRMLGMETKHRTWLVIIAAIALVCVIGWKNADDTGIGKWRVYETKDGNLILINSEDGKTWAGSAGNGPISWQKCDRQP